jgi:hypothetical protein
MGCLQHGVSFETSVPPLMCLVTHGKHMVCWHSANVILEESMSSSNDVRHTMHESFANVVRCLFGWHVCVCVRDVCYSTIATPGIY